MSEQVGARHLAESAKWLAFERERREKKLAKAAERSAVISMTLRNVADGAGWQQRFISWALGLPDKEAAA